VLDVTASQLLRLPPSQPHPTLSLKLQSFSHPSLQISKSKMWAGTSRSNPASPTTPQIPSQSIKLRHQGRRVAQIVKLKPECVEKYKECHAKVWPEVLKQIKECNIEDCELFSVERLGHTCEAGAYFWRFYQLGWGTK
jgi:hypothetical protein